jgi:sec-independent protein translocase protein TatA
MFEGLFQPMHLILILIICIFLFGPKKLPELGKALGDGIRGFREGMSPTPPPAAKTEETKTAENTQPK